MAAIFMVIASILITAGFRLVSDSARQAKQRNYYVAEAENVARAGIVDALGWFGRQSANGGVVFGNYSNSYAPGATPTVQPIYVSADDAFNPQGNTANTQMSDTIDAGIGIVKEYPLDDPVTAKAVFWARYEVWKQDAPKFTPVHGSTFNPYAAHDITGQRDTAHINGDGYVWTIACKGIVYRRMDKTVDTYGFFTAPYNQAPNTVVATSIQSAELRKLSLLMPQPTPNISISGGLYVKNIRSQVTLSSVETTLSGAVSTYNNYAAIGMTSP